MPLYTKRHEICAIINCNIVQPSHVIQKKGRINDVSHGEVWWNSTLAILLKAREEVAK